MCPATIQFFAGEYFCKTVTSHPKFKELQNVFWNIETRLYNRLSKKAKARRSLKLNTITSGFFANPNLINDPDMLSLQREILGTWAIFHHYFGVSIDWDAVLESAAIAGAIIKTASDYASLQSLQDIPHY
jgi:hypothetical protein